MPLTTTTQLDAPVNVDFQMNLLRRALAVAPFFVGSVAAEIAEHSGTFTAKWRRYDTMTAVTTPLAELTGSVAFPTRTAAQATKTDVTATVQKYGNFIFLNEEVDLINFNNQGLELSRVLGENAGRSLDRLQRNVIEDNGTAVLAGGATTATDLSATGGSFVTRTNLAQVVNTLNRNNADRFLPETRGSQNIGTSPIRESYWGICHSDTEEDVRNLTGFVSVEAYGGQTQTAMGEFGAVGGIRFVSTSESSIDTGTAASATASATSDARETSNRGDVYNTVVFGRDAVGSVGLGFQHVKEIYKEGDTLPGVMMIQKARGSAGAADPLNELSTLGWKSWHAGTILNDNWLRVLRHTASRLS